MIRPPRTALAFVAGLALLFAVPFAARALRGPGPARCAFDGQPLVDAESVRTDFGPDGYAAFCSVGCACGWLERDGRTPRSVVVRDERSGRPLDARAAYFVRSRVPTATVTRVPIHVFADADAARAHAAAHRGRVLDGLEHPFHPRPPDARASTPSPDSPKHEDQP